MGNGLNDQSILDTRKLITGKDGRLFISVEGGENIFLAEANDFSVQMNFETTEFQPVGSYLKYKVPTAYTVTLTVAEPVVRDDVMLTSLFKAIAQGFTPYFDFQGMLRRYDGEYERLVFRNCIPDGSVDLIGIKPGEIVTRNWNFTVNAPPELQEFIASKF